MFDVEDLIQRLGDNEHESPNARATMNEARAALDWQRDLLNGRDKFIVDHGLWQAFVDQLPNQ